MTDMPAAFGFPDLWGKAYSDYEQFYQVIARSSDVTAEIIASTAADSRNRRAGPFQRLVAFHDFIAAHNGASADIRMFGDHGKVADLRIAIDPPQNPGISFYASIAPDPVKGTW
jgi:hypothetical protein